MDNDCCIYSQKSLCVPLARCSESDNVVFLLSNHIGLHYRVIHDILHSFPYRQCTIVTALSEELHITEMLSLDGGGLLSGFGSHSEGSYFRIVESHLSQFMTETALR